MSAAPTGPRRAHDARVVEALLGGLRTRAGDEIRAAESVAVRSLVLVSIPVWGTALVLLTLGRIARGRRPWLVLHRRVGHARRPLLVPKIATASVERNDRRVFGLVEIASGDPIVLEIDGPFERWLRHSGLDELPQLALVVAGRMRIVGPRPVTWAEVATMLESGDRLGIDHLHPGLVGLWQVLDRHAYELGERRELDLAMVDHWCARLRRRILLRALRQVVRRIRGKPADR